MGWGSSIEVARQARAAQDALRRNDYTGAMNFAQRATKAAPQNPDFWFLLAYSARLAGRYSLTVYDAAYLELARRRDLPLATLDRDLRAAAVAGDVKLLGMNP